MEGAPSSASSPQNVAATLSRCRLLHRQKAGPVEFTAALHRHNN